jgi:hypothetical protein
MVMNMPPTHLQEELQQLSRQERLQLAHWLLDSLVEIDEQENKRTETSNGHSQPQPLLRWAGMFAGGPGDTAEQDEEILQAEIDAIQGWGGV